MTSVALPQLIDVLERRLAICGFVINKLILIMILFVLPVEVVYASSRCQVSLKSDSSREIVVERVFTDEESRVIADLASLTLAGQEVGGSRHRPEIVRSLLKEKQIELEQKVGREKTRKLFLEVQRRVLSRLHEEQERANSVATQEGHGDSKRAKTKIFRPIELKEFLHADFVSSAVFSPDGKYVLTVFHDRIAKLWDVASGSLVQSFVGHSDWVRSAVFSPDGKYVLTASDDGTVKLWETATGVMIHSYEQNSSSVGPAIFSPDGKYVLTTFNGTLRFWEVSSGTLHTFEGLMDWVMSAVFSPDGKYVLTSLSTHTARLWDVASGALVRSFEKHTGAVRSAVFSSDGRYLLTASVDNTAKLWHVASGTLVHSFEGHVLTVGSAIFSPDDKYVLTVSDDKSAKLWEVASGALIHTLKESTSRKIGSAVFSPDGRYLLTTRISEKVAKLWEIPSGRLVYSFEKHKDSVNSAVFSPDGKYVLTASYDKTAKLWSWYEEIDLNDVDIENVGEGAIHD